MKLKYKNMDGVTGLNVNVRILGELTLALLQSLEVLFQCQMNPNKAEQPE